MGHWHPARILVYLGLLFLLLLPQTDSPSAFTANTPAYVRRARTIETWRLGIPNPAGLAYWPDANAFVVVQAPSADLLSGGAETATLVSPFRDVLGSLSLGTRIPLPINMTWDGSADRLLLLDAASGELTEAALAVGQAAPWGITRSRLPDGLPERIEGMTVDPRSGTIFLLDGASRRVIRIRPDPRPDLDREAALLGGEVSFVALTAGSTAALGGIAFNPADGRLFALEVSARKLHELTQTGELVSTRDLSFLGLKGPQALMFAPSGDTTDDPSVQNLYIADSGGNQSGTIVELSLIEPPTPPPAPEVVPSSLVRTIATSGFSPASPDPSGLAYNPISNRLLIVDGEVEEMSIWANVNFWETTLTGTVMGTANVTSFSDEPVGMAYKSNGRWFISDDDKKKVFEIVLGPDGRLGTSDDTVTSITTTTFGSGDPEGLAYDAVRGYLYIGDGENGEVYQVRPGANGRFDGVPPAGDDQTSHFDTANKGYPDTEGIEYNPDSDTLYICSHGVNKILETTATGTVVREIDVSFLPRDVSSGLAYAPASNNPSVKDLYIADRGVDNNSDSRENDGRIYEITVSGGTSAVCGNGVREGGEICDGSDLGGQTCQSQGFSGGTLSCLSNCFAFDTSGCSTSNPNTVEVRVAVSSDDAEEIVSTGAISLTSSDLELVLDGSDQVVGVRFSGVPIAKNAQIANAYVQFTVDETTSETTTLLIQGQDSDTATAFTTTAHDLSSRPRTSASAYPWSPVAWNTADGAGPNQRTPNIALIIQEIVQRSGWASGNALAIIVTGTGHRVAEAYDKGTGGGALLHVELAVPAGCGNGALDPGEQCDGTLLGGANCTSQGCSGGTPRCLSNCTLDYSTCTGCQTCGNGIREGSEQCDGAQLGGATCADHNCTTGTPTCSSTCTLNYSACTICCGNGIREGSEQCDGAQLGGATCADRSCTGGNPTCSSACTLSYSTCTGCPVCGNGVRETGEVCDGNDLAGQTCVTQGFGSGTLGCRSDCLGFNTSSCSVCDLDGVCDAGENCNSCASECISSSPSCGNDICETANGEDCRSCPADCNGVQGGKPSRRYCCGDGDGTNPISCGDTRCTASGNTCRTTPTLTYCCGNGSCQSGETATNCAIDCGP